MNPVHRSTIHASDWLRGHPPRVYKDAISVIYHHTIITNKILQNKIRVDYFAGNQVYEESRKVQCCHGRHLRKKAKTVDRTSLEEYWGLKVVASVIRRACPDPICITVGPNKGTPKFLDFG